jgi:hypothetical protein
VDWIVVIQGATLDDFQKATPTIADIPSGTAMQIRFTPPAWTISSGTYYPGDPGDAEVINSWPDDFAEVNLYLLYWYNLAKNHLDSASTMNVQRVYRDGVQVVIEGTATGFSLLLAITLIVACIAAATIGVMSYFKDIRVSADAVVVAQLTARTATETSQEVITLAQQGFTSEEIQNILSAQEGVVNTVGQAAASTVAASQSSGTDWASMIKWGAIAVIIFIVAKMILSFKK